jgi:hypothetical protein
MKIFYHLTCSNKTGNWLRALSLACLLAFCCALTLTASSPQGASVYYQHLGGQRYKLMAEQLRDCRGLSFPSTIKGELRSGSCSTALTLTRDSIRELPLRCKNQAGCLPQNNVASDGREIQRYSIIVDFSQSPYNSYTQSSCCEVLFVMNDGHALRTSAITTVNGPSFVWAACTLNLCQRAGLPKNNNSAILAFDIPAYLRLNHTHHLSAFAVDPDGDSLAYQLTRPMTGPSSYVSYVTRFSASNPLTTFCPGSFPCTPSTSSNPPRGFNLNTRTGDMLFQTTSSNEVSLFAIEIIEFRRDSNGIMQKVGSTFHERIWININGGTNNPPAITLSGEATICAGEKRCFAIKLEDKPFFSTSSPDTLSWNWRSNHPNVSISTSQIATNEVSLQACFITAPGDSIGKSYFFSIQASDSYCPQPARSQRTMHVRVMRRPDFKMRLSKLPGSRMVLQLNSKDTTAQFSATVNLPDKTTRRYTFKRSSVSDTIQYPVAGNYYIEAEIKVPNACSYLLRDSIQLEGCLKLEPLSVSQNPACASLPLTLLPKVSNTVGTIQYRWSDGRNNILSTVDSLRFTPDRDTLIRLWVRDQVDCEASTSIAISSYLPKLSYQNPSVIFCSEGTEFDWAKITDVDPPDARFSSSLAGLVEQRSNGYFSSARIPLSGLGTQSTRVQIDYSDTAGCPVTGGFIVDVNPTPHSVLLNDTLCRETEVYPLFNLLQNEDNVKNAYLVRCYAGPIGPLYSVVNDNLGRYVTRGIYYMEMQTSDRRTGCLGRDSFTVELRGEPTYNVLTVDSPCALSPALELNPFVRVQSTAPKFNWNAVAYNGDATDPIIQTVIRNGDRFFPAKAGKWTLAFAESSTYCTLRDTFEMVVRPLAEPRLGNDTSINIDQTIRLSPGRFDSYEWNNGDAGQTRSIEARWLGLGRHLIWARVSSTETGCFASDSLYLSVLPAGTGIVRMAETGWVYPNPFDKQVQITQAAAEDIRLFTLSGQELPLTAEQVNGNWLLSLERLPAGTYLLQFSVGEILYRSILQKN